VNEFHKIFNLCYNERELNDAGLLVMPIVEAR
jgi:hypothetical protein